MHFTIADLARRTDLPRRTIQFWADKEVLEMDVDASAEGRERLFPQLELDIARMLRPFTRMGLHFKVLQLIAGVLRITDDGPEGNMDFNRLILSAKAGRPAYLAVQIEGEPGREVDYNITVQIARSLKELVAAISKQITEQPKLPVVVIDMTAALYEPLAPAPAPTKRRSATWSNG